MKYHDNFRKDSNNDWNDAPRRKSKSDKRRSKKKMRQQKIVW